ncbi:MAG: hypothetical protein Q9167_006579 [Letrouitia subvulpina]
MPTQTTSNAVTFVRGLRLLDLDLRDDWPGFTADTLSIKNAYQNHKTRLRCVEWALYRLFEIWDKEETRNKLQPFFPPLEPLQSLNLRAALFRYLGELKKQGVLGKDVMIRKTMLDECKGEKFEELLIAFQSAVLQKVLKDQEDNGSIVSQLAVARVIPKTSQRSLLPLAIAHRASLTALLRRKEQLRQRLSNFQRLLDEKEADLLQVVDRLAQGDGERDLRDDRPNNIIDTRKQFETYWRGDPRWINTLIGGGDDYIHDPLFEIPFNEIWPHVRDGTVDHIALEEKQDPLRDLENRIRSQRERLEHWREFQASIIQPGQKTKPGIDDNSKTYRPKGLELNLKKHLQPEDNIDMTVESQEDGSETVNISASSTDEYTNLINSFRLELDRVGQRKQQKTHAVLLGGPKRHDPESQNPPAEDDLKMYPLHSRSSSLLARQQPFEDPRRDDVPTRIPANISRRRSVPKPENSTTSEPQDLDLQQRETNKRPNHAQNNEISDLATFTLSDMISSEAKNPASETDEEDVLAQMIISSTRNAEPSPIKSRPSLMERTRQSIAFTRPELANLESLTDSDVPVPMPKPEKRNAVPDLSRRTSLIDRTRQSMSSLPSSSQELHKNTHKRRQSKQFPANPFETPNRPAALSAVGELKEMTPPESLFSEDVDYASVFKSRPKIATSPITSPLLAGTLNMQQESGFQDDKATPTRKGRGVR